MKIFLIFVLVLLQFWKNNEISSNFIELSPYLEKLHHHSYLNLFIFLYYIDETEVLDD